MKVLLLEISWRDSVGVDISAIVEKKEIELSALAGESIAIDAYNVLYQFLASIRQPDGTPLMDFKGNITSHLSGLFYRTERLLAEGIKPLYVFDGNPPPFKEKTLEEREKAKEEAMLKYEKALDMEIAYAKTYAQATIKLSKEMVEEAKELLNAMGVPYLVAPEEGEAQAACLAKNGIVKYSASQDYDSLLFGSPRLVRNLNITGKRKLPRKNEYVIIKPEVIELDKLLRDLGITREQLVIIGLLVGTDYNEGVKGIGAKTALKIVREYKTFDRCLEYVKNRYKHEFEPYIREVYEYFLNPPCIDFSPEWKMPDEEKIVEILVKRHDFSEERVRNTVKKMKEGFQKTSQSKLSQWF